MSRQICNVNVNTRLFCNRCIITLQCNPNPLKMDKKGDLFIWMTYLDQLKERVTRKQVTMGGKKKKLTLYYGINKLTNYTQTKCSKIFATGSIHKQTTKNELLPKRFRSTRHSSDSWRWFQFARKVAGAFWGQWLKASTSFCFSPQRQVMD